jgi:hypothetical protein
MAKNNNISIDNFNKWNPAVGSDCGKLLPGYWYCVAAGGNGNPTTTFSATTTSQSTLPTQTSVARNCNKFAPYVTGVYCYDMAQKYGISVDDFYKWNPDVGTDCKGLWPGYAYCVGVS